MSRTKRNRAERAKALVKARKRVGLTQRELDEQYRRAMEANPLNNAGGRGGVVQQERRPAE